MAEPDIEQWRAEARDWLASVLPRRSDRSDTAPDYAVFANISEEAEHAMLDRVRAYRRHRFDAGYGAIALPTELGGAGLSPRYVVAFTAEEQAVRGADLDRTDQRHNRACRADDRDLRHRHAAGEVRAGLPALGSALLSVVQ